MTQVTGTGIKNVANVIAATGTVTISTKPRMSGSGAYIDGRSKKESIVAGVLTPMEIEPGPVKIAVSIGSSYDTFDAVVPETGPVTLAALKEQTYVYEPPVIGQVQELVAEVQGLSTAQDSAIADKVESPTSETRTALNSIYAPAALAGEVDTLGVEVDAITADPTNAVTSIFIPAKAFDGVSAVPTYSVLNQRLSAWTLPKQSAGSNVNSQISTCLRLPSHWASMSVTVIFTITAAGSGNVSLNVGKHDWADGESVNVTPTLGNGISAIPVNAYENKQVTISPGGLAVDPTKTTTVRVDRNGTSGSDTWTGNIMVLGVKLNKVA